MTDSEVLQRAIEIAINKGYKLRHQFYVYKESPNLHIIYNHEFAKSLWGIDSWTTEYPSYTVTDETIVAPTRNMPTWQFHLQQMVISEDPIDYLRKYISEAV